MTRVAIYARHSSDKQTTSTKDQIARCRRYCDSKGYEIVDLFTDEAISGAIPIHNRKGIHDLIEMAMLGQFRKIVCEDLSRLSRDQGDIAHFYKRMSFLDILVETVSEGVVNELHIGLKGTMNALYLKDLGDKALRGMIAAVLKGGVPGSRTYGYDIVTKVENGEFVKGLRTINENEAQVIRNIFNWYLEGHSLLEICKTLNAQAIPSPSGKRWAPTTLVGTLSRQTGLLRQTLYKGLITFNKMTYKKDPLTGRRVSSMRPESEWVKVPSPEHAIISEELFDKVQKEIASRAKTRVETSIIVKSRTKEEITKRNTGYMTTWRNKQRKSDRQKQYLMSRRFWCIHCNVPIVCYTRDRERCKNERCDHHHIVKRPFVLQEIRDQLHWFAKKDLLPFNQQPHEQQAIEVQNLKKELDAKREKISNILLGLADRTKGPETLKFLDTLETDCVLLRAQYDKAVEKHQNMLPLSEEEMETVLKNFKQLINAYIVDEVNPKTVRKLRKYVTKVWMIKNYEVKLEYDLTRIVADFR